MSSIDEKGVNENSHDNSKDDMENGTYEVIKNRLLKQGTELKERVEKLNKELARVNGMLSNPNFVSKAPEKKINEEKAKQAKYQQMMDQVKEQLARLQK